ncbi:MAG: type II toxin-antitoxin system RelE/ParE family toxin [Deltaproteobacteria bacterium]|nr:type II toxin-antitoxin system RelE/ParE family toxin [Deltaproteobacteria bacterium]
MTTRLTPEAEADLTEAYAWYRDRGQSLAKDFLGSFEAVLETLDDHPGSFPEVHHHIRRALMRRFPYAVFYVVGVRGPVILGVFHARRDPKKWKRRTGA